MWKCYLYSLILTDGYNNIITKLKTLQNNLGGTIAYHRFGLLCVIKFIGVSGNITADSAIATGCPFTNDITDGIALDWSNSYSPLNVYVYRDKISSRMSRQNVNLYGSVVYFIR